MIRMSGTCVADMSELDKFFKGVIKLESCSVETGFGEKMHPDANMSTAELSYILNNGADLPNGEIPPRQFMESSSDLFEEDNKRITPLVVRQILFKGADPTKQLMRIGRKQKQVMQQVMDFKLFAYPNNAPSTIRIKCRDDALIDTKFLRKSIEITVDTNTNLGGTSVEWNEE